MWSGNGPPSKPHIQTTKSVDVPPCCPLLFVSFEGRLRFPHDRAQGEAPPHSPQRLRLRLRSLPARLLLRLLHLLLALQRLLPRLPGAPRAGGVKGAESQPKMLGLGVSPGQRAFSSCLSRGSWWGWRPLRARPISFSSPPHTACGPWAEGTKAHQIELDFAFGRGDVHTSPPTVRLVLEGELRHFLGLLF